MLDGWHMDFEFRLVAYAHKTSVARVLEANQAHAMFGDRLKLSPVSDGPGVLWEGQDTSNTANDINPAVRCCALKASSLQLCQPNLPDCVSMNSFT